MQQKHIKDFLRNEKYKSLTNNDFKYKLKANQIYKDIEDEDWKTIFLSMQQSIVDNKTKELQYKIIMRYVPTNHLLYKMGKVVSNSCTFCMLETETIEHLFYECHIVKSFWWEIFNDFNTHISHRFSPSMTLCVLSFF